MYPAWQARKGEGKGEKSLASAGAREEVKSERQMEPSPFPSFLPLELLRSQMISPLFPPLSAPATQATLYAFLTLLQ